MPYSSDFTGFTPRANLQQYVMIPIEFFSELPNITTLAELKVVLAVFRKTYGWIERVEDGAPIYKVEDDISYSQFEEMTGLTGSAVSDGIKQAIAHGYLIKVKNGGLNEGSSRYRITQKGEALILRPEEQPIPGTQPPHGADDVKEMAWGDFLDKLSDLQNKLKEPEEAKAEALDEIRAYTTVEIPEEQPTRKRKLTQDFKVKPLEKWNCNDLLAYFNARYQEFLGIQCPLLTGKDRGQAKMLLDKSGLSVLEIVKAINYYLKNYRYIKGIPEGFPSWKVFFNWRDTIIPQALVGEDKIAKGGKNTSVREYIEPATTTKQKPADSWE